MSICNKCGNSMKALFTTEYCDCENNKTVENTSSIYDMSDVKFVFGQNVIISGDDLFWPSKNMILDPILTVSLVDFAEKVYKND